MMKTSLYLLSHGHVKGAFIFLSATFLFLNIQEAGKHEHETFFVSRNTNRIHSFLLSWPYSPWSRRKELTSILISYKNKIDNNKKRNWHPCVTFEVTRFLTSDSPINPWIRYKYSYSSHKSLQDSNPRALALSRANLAKAAVSIIYNNYVFKNFS